MTEKISPIGKPYIPKVVPQEKIEGVNVFTRQNFTPNKWVQIMPDVKYDEQAVAAQNEFKRRFEELEALAAKLNYAPRPVALVMTKLDEAYMWIGKAIRDDQIARERAAGVKTEEQPERKNG